ncbi:MAG TPA: DUF4232 domain-containing protein [Solirubrobacteraceae bacterium]
MGSTKHPKMRLAIAMLSVLALGLAACGGSSQPASQTSTKHADQPPQPATTSTPTTATTAPTPASSTPTAPPGPAPCTSSDLALSFLGQQGATGRGELGFALRNISGSSCHTYGYPGIQFLDRAGQPLPTLSTRTTHDYFGNAPVQALLIEPGNSVSFRLGVTHGIASSAGCSTAYELQVIAPDDTHTIRLVIPDGGAYECRTATVSPLRPGDSAYP